jgi:hypothetical protein
MQARRSGGDCLALDDDEGVVGRETHPVAQARDRAALERDARDEGAEDVMVARNADL